MNSLKKMAVLGAGGFAAEIVEAAELAGWTITRLYDDDATAIGRVVMGKICVGKIGDFVHEPKSAYIFAIGSNEVRQRLASALLEHGHEAIVLVHPTATVSRSALLGPGAYVAANAFVGPQAKVGQHVIVNVGASIGHDALLGDWTQLCPGARVSGFAVLGEGAFMGSNAVLGPHAVLGEWSKLGAASFASRSVKARSLAIGVPARIVSS